MPQAASEKQVSYLADAIARLEAAMIDPREFGRLEAQVGDLKAQVTGLQNDMRQLLELANKSKGGFWMGMTLASLFGGIATFIVEHFLRR